MTSYHDLEETTYQTCRANPFTRIHGLPTWRTKERLKEEASKLGVQMKVSYNWSGNRGLLALIIGGARHAVEYPTLPGYVEPTRPDSMPNYPNANPSGTQERIARNANDILKRDWAVVCGFKRGVGENIRDALDPEYYEELEHPVYGYDDVKPFDYFEHLEDHHCPLEEQAIKQARGN